MTSNASNQYSIIERAAAWLCQRKIDDGADLPEAQFILSIPGMVDRFGVTKVQAAEACCLALDYRLSRARGIDIASHIEGAA